jgi:RNA-binding protein
VHCTLRGQALLRSVCGLLGNRKPRVERHKADYHRLRDRAKYGHSEKATRDLTRCTDAGDENSMVITGKKRAELRAEAHHLDPLVQLGAHGVTPMLITSLDDALRTRELVKVQLGRPVEEKPRAIAERLAQETGAVVVQVIGRTATLYRENPELERKDGAPPPWRR